MLIVLASQRLFIILPKQKQQTVEINLAVRGAQQALGQDVDR